MKIKNDREEYGICKHLSLVWFPKNFKILRYIESLDVCMEH